MDWELGKSLCGHAQPPSPRQWVSPLTDPRFLLPRPLPLCQLSLPPPLPLPSSDSFQLQLPLLNPSVSEHFPGQPSEKRDPSALCPLSPWASSQVGWPQWAARRSAGTRHDTQNSGSVSGARQLSFEGTRSPVKQLHWAGLLKFRRCPECLSHARHCSRP